MRQDRPSSRFAAILCAAALIAAGGCGRVATSWTASAPAATATGIQGLLPTGGTWQLSQDWTG